jgi:phosphate transport system permease protein
MSTGSGAQPGPAPVDDLGTGGATPRSGRAIAARAAQLLRPSLGLAGVVPLVALAFVLVVLLLKAWPAIVLDGAGFFTKNVWNPGGAWALPVVTHGISHPQGSEYGALSLLVGTLQTSAIALIVAVPVGVGTALLVVEKLPRRLSSSMGLLLETLAGIPSVVYGLWGIFTLGPFLARDVAPAIADHVPDVPVLSFFRGPTGHGEGLLTSGLVLAIMVVPIVAATTRDLLRQVPRPTVEGAMALGMTDAEVVRTVHLRWARAGIIGASVLGLGRALGETMAVAMVSGSQVGAVTHNLYGTMTTFAATIVSQLDGALTDGTGFAVSVLAEAAIVLLIVSLIANIGARILVHRVASTALPVGRGI